MQSRFLLVLIAISMCLQGCKPALQGAISIAYPMPVVAAVVMNPSLILDHECIVDLHNKGKSGRVTIIIKEGAKRWVETVYMEAGERKKFSIPVPRVGSFSDVRVSAFSADLTPEDELKSSY